MLLVQLHDLLLHPLRILLVAFLDRLDLRLHRLHRHARPHRLLVERPEQHPDGDPEEDEHPSVAEVQGVVHPEEDADDEVRERSDDGTEDPAVGIDVLQVVADAAQAPELLGTEIDRVAEAAPSRRQRRHHVRANLVLAGGRPSLHARPAHARLPFRHRQDALHEVLGLDRDPLERPGQLALLARIQRPERQIVGLGSLGDDAVRPDVLRAVRLHQRQPGPEPDQQEAGRHPLDGALDVEAVPIGIERLTHPHRERPPGRDPCELRRFPGHLHRPPGGLERPIPHPDGVAPHHEPVGEEPGFRRQDLRRPRVAGRERAVFAQGGRGDPRAPRGELVAVERRLDDDPLVDGRVGLRVGLEGRLLRRWPDGRGHRRGRLRAGLGRLRGVGGRQPRRRARRPGAEQQPRKHRDDEHEGDGQGGTSVHHALTEPGRARWTRTGGSGGCA